MNVIAVRLGRVALAVPVLWLAASCGGGGDDIEDARKTATAAAQSRPSPTATLDVAAAYRRGVNDGVETLTADLARLNQDLLGAQANQADPKWPAILQTDITAVRRQADALGALTPAPDLASFHAALKAELAQIAQGCDMLANAITRAEPAGAAEGVALIFDGRDQVLAKMQELPPQ
jgi:hypothetical protein